MWLSLCLFGLYLLGRCAANQIEEITSEEQLQQLIQSNHFLVVEFYAPWCGACKKFAQPFERASEEFKQDAAFAKLDAWNESYIDITRRFNVSSYPTIFFFKDSVPIEFEGELHYEGFEADLRRKLRPILEPLRTPEDVQQAVQKDRIVVVGLFATETDPVDQERISNYRNIAQQQADRFYFCSAVTPDAALLSHLNVTSLPSYVVLKSYDDGNVVYNGPEADMPNWLLAQQYPLVDEIGRHNSRLYTHSGLPIFFFFYQTPEQKEEWTPVLKQFARETRNRLNFVFINWEKYGVQSTKLGLSGTQVPAAAIENTKTKHHFAFSENEPLNTEALKAWMNKFLNGDLKPTYRSQPVPTEEDSAVRTVVGSNFAEVVMDSEKDVLVEFYSPNCGHCKNLAPIYEELAQKHRNSRKLVISKIDSTANDISIEGFQSVNMYPTLRLYKADRKSEPIEFTAKERTIETMEKFLWDHGSIAAISSSWPSSYNEKTEL